VLLNHKSQYKFKNNLHLKNLQEEKSKKILQLLDLKFKETQKKKKKRKLKGLQKKKKITYFPEAAK
jgi:hypothetical protein